MVFNPGLEKNQVIDNNDLCSIFKCSPQGGMRRSHRTNTLAVISDHTKGIYGDKWINGVLHYVGMGLLGDQSLDFHQNKTLAQSQTNDVKVYLFEVLTRGEYTYRGEVKLVGEPYKTNQLDREGNNRLVWIFPLSVI
jgi:5-methylcytosine-specific restriction protein A